MARDIRAIEITKTMDLLKLAEEVRTRKEPYLLRRDSEDIAVLMPVKPAKKARRKTPTAEDIAAFEEAAGGWSDVDTDRFLADNAHSRRISTLRSITP